MSSVDFAIIVVRLPQANIAAKRPAISMSWGLLKRWGTAIGSKGTKPGWLNSSVFASRNSRSFLLVIGFFIIDSINAPVISQSPGQDRQSNHPHLRYQHLAGSVNRLNRF